MSYCQITQNLQHFEKKGFMYTDRMSTVDRFGSICTQTAIKLVIEDLLKFSVLQVLFGMTPFYEILSSIWEGLNNFWIV